MILDFMFFANTTWSCRDLKLYGNYLKQQLGVNKIQPFFDVDKKSIINESIEDQCHQVVDVNQNKTNTVTSQC